MAGFGTVLAPALFDAYPGRVLNTHPALLPAFKGWHAVDDALAAGVKVTGCTRARGHRRGGLRSRSWPRRRSRCCRRTPARRLHERIKAVERRLYPETIRKLHRRRFAVRALLSVYDKTGLIGFAEGLVGLGHRADLDGRHLARPGRGRHPLPQRGVGHRRAGDARRAGQDPPPEDPRRHPGRPVQARAPRRPRGPRDRADRPGGLQPLPVPLRSLHRADRRRRPDHGAGRGQELRPRRRRSSTRPTTAPCSTSCAGEGELSAATRRRLARAAFAHTAAYDAAIATWFDELEPDAGTAARRRSTWPWRRPSTCATARTPTSRGRGTGRPVCTAGGTTSCSTAGWSCPTSTSTTPTRPGGWSTSWPTSGRPRRWSSSTPTPAGRRWPTTSWPPTTGRSNAIRCRRSAASWPCPVRSASSWPPSWWPTRRPTCSSRPRYDAGRARAVRGQAEEHAGPRSARPDR